MFQEARGANQAVAAAWLGAEARFAGAVGDDDFPASRRRRHSVRRASGPLGLQRIATPTGIALILVDETGENQIVAPGANHALDPARIDVGEPDALICQLDVRDDAIAAALEFEAFFCLNAAPRGRSRAPSSSGPI